MTELRPWQVPAGVARLYLEHVVALGPVRLSDLAYQMFDTGGPIESMDGSLESLEPFWAWFISRMQAGFPEIPEGSAPSRTRLLQWELTDITGRVAYAIEPMGHYLLEVLKRYDPSAHWTLYKPVAPDDAGTHTTVAQVADGRQFPLEQIPYVRALKVLKDMNSTTPASFLMDKVRHQLELDTFGPPVAASGSILTDYLKQPRIPSTDPRRLPPAVGAELRAHPFPDRVISSIEQCILADPNADLGRLSDARSLDPEILAEELAAMGGHIRGVAATATDLLREGTIVVIKDHLMAVSAVVSGGEIKALDVEPIRLSEAEWLEFEAGMGRIAQRTGAVFDVTSRFRGEKP